MMGESVETMLSARLERMKEVKIYRRRGMMKYFFGTVAKIDKVFRDFELGFTQIRVNLRQRT